MPKFLWSIEKNRALKEHSDRHICFEDIVAAIDAGGLLDDIEHPNVEKYPNQRMLVVLFSGYVDAVPYVRLKSVPISTTKKQG
ncbi:hypothetical protein [Pararhizobium sp. LjRoot238]|uniref:hypothetical protein n=1 Tax=Pararhizobium sp. LjRoot238 TaxID=3342293 RepID=UPI003ECF106C